MSKLLGISEAAKLCAQLKQEQKLIGLCHGTFDFIHLGHITHFEEAKKTCDKLFVSITPDRFVIKGKGRPFYSESERVHFLSAISCIDKVIVNDSPDSISLLERLGPNFYFKGPDYRNFEEDKTEKIKLEVNAVEKSGGKFITTSKKDFSSTEILHRLKTIQ